MPKSWTNNNPPPEPGEECEEFYERIGNLDNEEWLIAAGDAPALMIDGTVIASNTQGRLLCTVRDVRPGTFEISRPATSKGVYV